MATDSKDRIEPRRLEDEMRDSFIDYSMSVIVQRALPDVRDGLKPVHRRILFAMHEAGLGPSRPYRKSATVVGDVIGKYHPHGDSAVYDSMVRMAQDFSLRYPLVDGQGNFGSIDGDSAAAYRYTEARMAGLASELLTDIDKETVLHVPNFDDRLREPTVLPSALPNLLVNGSSGIAVGMATNIPPHNLREIAAACQLLINNPEATLDEIMKLVRGPDFPTGGTILGRKGIRRAYRDGRGRIVMRGRSTIEETKDDYERIVITEIPFMVNKTRLIEQIAGLVRDRRVTDIRDLRDESGRDGIRIVVELKRDATAQVVLNQLHRGTQLQSTFGVIMLALAGGTPDVMNLKTMLLHFLAHRHEIVHRRTIYEHRAAKERQHILEGLRIAVENIDEVIRIIRRSEETSVARAQLMASYGLSEAQTDAILNMRLARLTGLEIEKLQRELAEVRERRRELEAILASRDRRMEIVGEELAALVAKYGDERRTEIGYDSSDLSDEDLIAEERTVIIVSRTGYIKRLDPGTFREQLRGGGGIAGMVTKEGDWVQHVFLASTHDYLLIFTRGGRLHWLKVYRIPVTKRRARGKPIVNLVNLGKGEEVADLLKVRNFEGDRCLIFATEKGLVKKTQLGAYRHVRVAGLNAIRIAEDDRLIDVQLTGPSNDVILATTLGKAIRFPATDVRPTGRVSQGVRGIRLADKDAVIGMVVVRRGGTLLTATEGGKGKRSHIGEYRRQGRGGKGVINLKPSPESGRVIAVHEVADDDELLLVTKKGLVIRQSAKDTRITGRNTQGVWLIKLKAGDVLADVACQEGEVFADVESETEPADSISETDLAGSGSETPSKGE